MQILKRLNSNPLLSKVMARAVIALALFIYGCATPVLAPQGGKKAPSELQEAESHYKSGNLNKALELYLTFLSRNPNDPNVPDVKLRCAEIFQRLNQPYEAQKYLKDIFYQYPNYDRRLEIGINLAKIQYSLKQYQASNVTLNEVLKSAPDSETKSNCLILKSKNYFELKDYKQALANLLLALGEDPPDKRGLLEYEKDLVSRLTVEELEDLEKESNVSSKRLRLLISEKYRALSKTEASKQGAGPSIRDTEEEKGALEPGLRQKPDRAKRELKVGALLPLTGPFSELGKDILAGIEFAIGQIRNTKESPYEEVRLVTRDVQDTEKALMDGVRVLMEKEMVDVLLGPVGGQFASLLVEEKPNLFPDIPVYLFTQRTDLLAPNLKVFNGLISPQDQVKPLLEAASEAGIKSYAVVFPETPYGKGLSERLREAFSSLGLKNPQEISYSSETKDFGNLAEALRQVDAFFVLDTLNVLGLILGEMTQRGIGPKVVLATDIWNPKDLLGFLSATENRALIATSLYQEEIPLEEPRVGLANEFFGSTKRPLNLFSLSAYLTMRTLALGTGFTGGANPRAPNTQFDKRGQLVSPPSIFWYTGKTAIKVR